MAEVFQNKGTQPGQEEPPIAKGMAYLVEQSVYSIEEAPEIGDDLGGDQEIGGDLNILDRGLSKIGPQGIGINGRVTHDPRQTGQRPEQSPTTVSLAVSSFDRFFQSRAIFAAQECIFSAGWRERNAAT